MYKKTIGRSVLAFATTREEEQLPKYPNESSASPVGQSPPQQNSMTSVIEVLVHSVMEGVKDAKLSVPVDATVFELKRMVHLATDVTPERQLLLFNDKELSDNAAPISYYGIVSRCTLTLNVKMYTGIKIDHAAEMVVFMPVRMPSYNSSNLRSTIRSMTNVVERRPTKVESTSDSSMWTPAKQMEHELTRNRMKKLLRRRKRTSISKSSSPQAIYTPGSIMSRSPTGALSPPSESAVQPAHISRVRTPKMENLEITEKDLKLFFEPAESIDELCRTQQEIFLPPETVADLNQFKKDKEELEKTMCKICRSKLALSEQQMVCHCQFVFCSKHREPSAHLCQIDYKQAGRRKIRKENPKVDGRGFHKTQMLD